MSELQSNLSIADMLYSGHIIMACFVKPAESRSNSLRKSPIQRTIVVEDVKIWHRVKSSSQIYLFIADAPIFGTK